MNEKVMVVDDSIMIRQQVRHALADAGFFVLEAIDGRDALKKIEEGPDVRMIVLDVNMPNMNGLEFLEALRTIPAHAALPVVMLTTEGQPRLLKQAKALGAIGWIIKPFKPEMIVATARTLCAEGK